MATGLERLPLIAKPRVQAVWLAIKREDPPLRWSGFDEFEELVSGSPTGKVVLLWRCKLGKSSLRVMRTGMLVVRTLELRAGLFGGDTITLT